MNSYRLTSFEEPTDEMLSQIMKEVAEEVRIKNAETDRRFMANLRKEVERMRKLVQQKQILGTYHLKSKRMSIKTSFSVLHILVTGYMMLK